MITTVLYNVQFVLTQRVQFGRQRSMNNCHFVILLKNSTFEGSFLKMGETAATAVAIQAFFLIG